MGVSLWQNGEYFYEELFWSPIQTSFVVREVFAWSWRRSYKIHFSRNCSSKWMATEVLGHHLIVVIGSMRNMRVREKSAKRKLNMWPSNNPQEYWTEVRKCPLRLKSNFKSDALQLKLGIGISQKKNLIYQTCVYLSSSSASCHILNPPFSLYQFHDTKNSFFDLDLERFLGIKILLKPLLDWSVKSLSILFGRFLISPWARFSIK